MGLSVTVCPQFTSGTDRQTTETLRWQDANHTSYGRIKTECLMSIYEHDIADILVYGFLLPTSLLVDLLQWAAQINHQYTIIQVHDSLGRESSSFVTSYGRRSADPRNAF
jgi:hypothetical protein